MKPQVKTIDIQAKEWFDKVNGNSYFAGVITVNYGKDSEMTFKMPMQYGYGEQYVFEALTILENSNIIDSNRQMILKDQGIIINSSIQTGCKKSDLKNI